MWKTKWNMTAIATRCEQELICCLSCVPGVWTTSTCEYFIFVSMQKFLSVVTVNVTHFIRLNNMTFDLHVLHAFSTTLSRSQVRVQGHRMKNVILAAGCTLRIHMRVYILISQRTADNVHTAMHDLLVVCGITCNSTQTVQVTRLRTLVSSPLSKCFSCLCKGACKQRNFSLTKSSTS